MGVRKPKLPQRHQNRRTVTHGKKIKAYDYAFNSLYLEGQAGYKAHLAVGHRLACSEWQPRAAKVAASEHIELQLRRKIEGLQRIGCSIGLQHWAALGCNLTTIRMSAKTAGSARR